MRKLMFAALFLAAPMALAGCAAGTQLSSSAPTQVTTLAEAEQSATLVTQAADLYVTHANPTAAQLTQINALSNAVHAALADLEAANAQEKSLLFDSFNAAIVAFDTYEASVAPSTNPTPSASASAGT